MTTPSQDLVPVTQADREIAARIHEGPPWRHDRTAAMVRAGKADDDQLVRAAATARKEGEALGMERAAGIAERWNGDTRDGNTFYIATAIREASRHE